MGASILQMEGQTYPYDDVISDTISKLKGDTHRTAVFAAGLVFGYDFYDNFNLPIRAELDFTSRAKADYNYSAFAGNGTIRTLKTTYENQIELNTLMLNIHYDFKNPSKFTPYLSAGLGYAYINQKTSSLFISDAPTLPLASRSHATNNFAWSAAAGLKYMVNQDFSFDLSYKYLDAGQGEVGFRYFNSDVQVHSKTKVRTHDIMLSATYHF